MDNLEQRLFKLKDKILKYWDAEGVDIDMTMKLFHLRPLFKNELRRWHLDYLGGPDKILEDLKKLENKILRAQIGSYDFRFYIIDPYIYEFGGNLPEFYFDAVVDENGQVSITTTDDIWIATIGEALKNSDVGWEVEVEIGDVIGDTITKILNTNLVDFYVKKLKVFKLPY